MQQTLQCAQGHPAERHKFCLTAAFTKLYKLEHATWKIEGTGEWTVQNRILHK
jgi:hypothetical protein